MSQEKVHRFITKSQLEQLRDAAHSRSQRYDTSLRDELIVLLGYILGLRVKELVRLKKSMFRLDQGEVTLPSRIQKDYPTGETPSPATLRLDPYDDFGVVRLLRMYFKEIDDEYLFPSREGGHIGTETARNVVEELAVEAGVEPHRTDGEPSEEPHRTDGEPSEASELHPHALRHSLANYMLQHPDTRLIDVRNRLRHRSIQTTEQIYEHFQRR